MELDRSPFVARVSYSYVRTDGLRWSSQSSTIATSICVRACVVLLCQVFNIAALLGNKVIFRLVGLSPLSLQITVNSFKACNVALTIFKSLCARDPQ